MTVLSCPGQVAILIHWKVVGLIPVGVHARGSWSVFLSQMDVSLALPPSLSLKPVKPFFLNDCAFWRWRNTCITHIHLCFCIQQLSTTYQTRCLVLGRCRWIRFHCFPQGPCSQGGRLVADTHRARGLVLWQNSVWCYGNSGRCVWHQDFSEEAIFELEVTRWRQR